MRYLIDGLSVQRWLCRDCGYRFSEKAAQFESKLILNRSSTLVVKRRICALEKDAKKLTSATETKTVAGDLSRLPQDARGLITKFMAYLEREGYCKDTKYARYLNILAKRGANLTDPENVKTIIAQQKVKDGTKIQWVAAYTAFAKMQKINWEPPKYSQEEILPFIPDEKELDLLISFCRSKRMARLPTMLKRNLDRPRRSIRTTMDRHLRKHHNHKQTSKRTPAKTAPNQQQTRSNAKCPAKNIRKNIPNKIRQHSSMLPISSKKRSPHTPKPTPALNRT